MSKFRTDEQMANPTYKPGGGSPVNSVSKSEMLRLKDSVTRKRESEARARKTDAATRKAANTAFNTDTSSSVPKFGGVGNYSSIGGKAPVSAAPKPKAKPAMPAPKLKAKATAAAAAPKPKAKPAMPASSGTGFKGNWKGAAPTAMQSRAKAKESSFQRTQRMQRDRGVGGR